MVNGKHDWFGCALYLFLSAGEMDKYLDAVFLRSSGEVAGIQMKWFSTMKPGSRVSNRDREITPQSLSRLRARCNQGKVGTIFLTDRFVPPNAQFVEARPAQLLVEIEPCPRGSREIRLSGPRETFDQAASTTYFRQVVESLPVHYGYLMSGHTWYQVHTVIDLTPQGRLEDFLQRLRSGDDNAPEDRFHNEIGFYQFRSAEFFDMVPRASWGNILSPHHIDKLGGEKKIRQECGCYLVEWWGDNLYLQLTESLWDTTPDALLRLNNYFEPIRFPGAPYPVYL